MTFAQGQGAFVPVSAWGKRSGTIMDFRTHRPQRGFGRSERSLAKIAEELPRFLTKAQRSLTYDTLHLPSRKRETLASLLVECAEDLSHDIGIWRSLEHYNSDFFGTPLPCVLQPGEEMDAEPINPERMQYLLWTLYAELEPGLILAPNHQDLERLALWIAEFLSARLARVRYDSGVKTFLTTPNHYGWDVKRKLVWLGQHSYLFRLPCAHYVRDHGGTADIPTLDDFLCQETTHWSGLGVIDILAAALDITDDQCRDLRSWYERHRAYFRVVSLREPFMDVINLLNELPYTIHVGEIGDTFRVDDVVFGSLVPWDGVWYWSGVQQKYAQVTDEVIQQIKRDFPLHASQVVYRYCPPLAEKVRAIVGKHYQQFLDYYGTDLVTYPDGKTMAADVQKFHQYQFATAPKAEVEAFLKRHHLSAPSPQVDWSPELLACDDGIGVYFNPEEGQEMMMSFDDVCSGFQKRGGDLTADESEMVRQFLYADAISPQFVKKLVQDYGDASIAAAFVIPQDCDTYYVEYFLRRYKGPFYRKRYPSLTIVDA
jgi:Protein of unknown function (DUF3843)